MALQHFLLIYDVEKGSLIGPPTKFSKARQATDAYAAAEQQYRDDSSIQVVLVASDSIESVMVTHSNFFVRESIGDVLRELLGETAQIH